MTIQEFFQEHPAAAVAFSGGVDSAWLLHEAAAWAERTAAYFVHTPFQPDFELADARETAGRIGAELTVIDFDILTVPEAAANPPDRCYSCKRALFTLLLEAARRDGFPLLLDGSNASDDAEDRPGMRALRELGVRSPLRECGVTKADIRRLSREAGLPVWDKPSYACLATRFPTGQIISRAGLEKVERSEAALSGLGLRNFRLRLTGDGAKLQAAEDQLPLVLERRRDILSALEPDFSEITLDLRPRAPID